MGDSFPIFTRATYALCRWTFHLNVAALFAVFVIVVPGTLLKYLTVNRTLTRFATGNYLRTAITWFNETSSTEWHRTPFSFNCIRLQSAVCTKLSESCVRFLGHHKSSFHVLIQIVTKQKTHDSTNEKYHLKAYHDFGCYINNFSSIIVITS